jgi:hypothetical protein
MIPTRIKEAIDLHVTHGQSCGSFVSAVLLNDLKDSIGMADEECLANIRDIVGYCYNKLPSCCWGSKEKVRVWREHQGFEGLPHGSKGFEWNSDWKGGGE